MRDPVACDTLRHLVAARPTKRIFSTVDNPRA